ncbi:MAG: valine--tRNA ligase [Deltaproteobacteria bacterium]
MAVYDPKTFEAKWYQRWVEAGEFAPRPAREGEQTFSMVIPPPNITGSLHLGHALNNTLQDVLARYHRMRGRAVLWVPGTDHAGIATQNVVERQLLVQGKTRDDLGREAFVAKTWEWRDTSGRTITGQLKRLGVSCDWEHERFTMDEGLSQAVREVFVRLHERGLVSRDTYLINWCARCRTALSDIEVEHEDRAGQLWHLRYPLADGSGSVSVATTRPETMLGDTAVAVHPDDERYSSLAGAEVVVPVVERRIPVIADTWVDREFGSGAVKITPGHDPNDYEMGLRHDLPVVSVMCEDGTMSDEAGPYAGMTSQECRRALVERFKADGTLERVEDHAHSVGTCYRCQTVVEPMISLQWFVDVSGMAARALEAVDDGRTKFVPEHWSKTYRSWMERIRPWCVSRQLWWGHRIPAWYCDPCGKTHVSRQDLDVCPDCGGAVRQDEDVLDTWFSSALWPFSTLGWPETTEDLGRFYPTSVLVTSFDIIFFWVARMMMMGLEVMDRVPFADVYIHALVRDEHGQKMSKSKGNIIDPLEIIDEYGADAFRFTLVAFAAMGRDIRLSADRIGGYRNFVNKLWNAMRFVELNRDADTATCAAPESPRTLAGRWILSRLAGTSSEVREALDGYRFNDAASALYRFTWHEFCDWYIEMSKADLAAGGDRATEARQVLDAVAEALLRLLHPFIPFVTEELWQGLPETGRAGASIMAADYPASGSGGVDEEAEAEVGAMIEVVRAVRNIRSEMNIAPKARLTLQVGQGPAASVLRANEGLVARLAGLDAFEYDRAPTAGAAIAVAAATEVSVPVAGHVDLGEEAARLKKQLARLDKEIGRISKKLDDPSFIERAPGHIVERERGKHSEALGERDTLARSLERVEAIGEPS